MKKLFVFLLAIAMGLMANAQESVTLTISDVSDLDEYPTLTITSDVSLADYSAFQFDLLLPEGVRMPYVENVGYGYYETIRGKKTFIDSYYSGIAPGHNIEVSEVTGGYRFLCYNSSNQKFEETDEEGNITVLTLEVEFNNAINGTYPITLSGTRKFSKLEGEQAVSIVPSFVPGKCTITGGVATTTIPFSMTDAGWGTLIVPFDAEIPSGLTAYSCSQYSSIDEVNWLELEKAQSMTANTPYILSGVAGDYNFTGTPNFEQTSYTEGMLTGVYVATAIDHGYVLQKQDDEVAFFKVPDGKTKTVPAYRCYLNDQPSGAIMFRIGGATQIEQAIKDTEPGDGFIYDLQGRRCNDDLQPGLYIRNNQLFYVK